MISFAKQFHALLSPVNSPNTNLDNIYQKVPICFRYWKGTGKLKGTQNTHDTVCPVSSAFCSTRIQFALQLSPPLKETGASDT